jgi:hypothetical protein
MYVCMTRRHKPEEQHRQPLTTLHSATTPKTTFSLPRERQIDSTTWFIYDSLHSTCGRTAPVNLNSASTNISVVTGIRNVNRIGTVLTQTISLFFLRFINSSSLNLVTSTSIIFILVVTTICYNYGQMFGRQMSWVHDSASGLFCTFTALPHASQRKRYASSR